MKQTCILYGNPNGDRVLITNCVTEQFSQEAVFDPSNTDLMFHKFIVVVSGFVNGSNVLFSKDNADPPNVEAPVSSVAGGVGGGLTSGLTPGDTAKQHVSFRSLLLEPRQSFEMRTGCNFQADDVNKLLGGTVLLKADPHPFVDASLNRRMSPNAPSDFTAGIKPAVGSVSDAGDFGGYDLNNGPRCTRCDVIQVVGNQVFRIRVQFEICKLECDAHGQANNNNLGVLSNRWSVSDDVDENFFTTRRFSGVLRVATAQLNAHEFRSWVVPPLQGGFRRQSMAFRVSEDSLTLSYDITDRETVWSAPGDATRWQMRHTENSGGNGLQTMSVAVSLWGDRKAVQIELLKIALAICSSKAIPGGTTPATLLPEISLTTESGTDEHSVSVVWSGLRGIRPNGNGIATDIGIDTKGLGIAEGLDVTSPKIAAIPDIATYDPSLSRGARPGQPVEVSGPLSFAQAWRSYLQSPCDTHHQISLTGDANVPTINNVATAVSIAVVAASAITNTPSPWVNSEQADTPYTVWDMITEYVYGSNVVMLGVAQSVAGYASSGAATAAFGRLGPDTTKRTVEITAIRVGKEPDIPKIPDTYPYAVNGSGGGGTARLLDKKIKAKPPDRAADGTQVFKTCVSLVYGLTHPPTDSDPLPIGTNGWESSSLPKHILNPLSAFTGPSVA